MNFNENSVFLSFFALKKVYRTSEVGKFNFSLDCRFCKFLIWECEKSSQNCQFCVYVAMFYFGTLNSQRAISCQIFTSQVIFQNQIFIKSKNLDNFVDHTWKLELENRLWWLSPRNTYFDGFLKLKCKG